MGIALSYSGAETKPENSKSITIETSTVSLLHEGGEIPKSCVAEEHIASTPQT
jgi:hypothetical protein